jgi:periplasmic protein TonB
MVIAQDEQRTKTIAAALTLVVAGLVFLVLLVKFSWGSAGAAGDDLGMEVNLGYDNVGYGNVQPDAPIGNDKPLAQEEQSAQAPPPSPPSTPVEEASKPAEAKPVDPEPVAASDEESPVEINEKKKKEVKQPVEKTPEKPKEKPVPEKPKEDKKEPVKEPVKEVKKDPAPDNKALYKPGASSTANKGGEATGKEGKPGNHGDDPGTVGDKGNPQGSPDAKALYGKQGGGAGGTGGTGTTGASLDLNGWQWDDRPRPVISNKNETGRLELEIQVDEDGELVGYKKISGGLSAATEAACIEALKKASFSKDAGATVPQITKGRVVFTVRSE